MATRKGSSKKGEGASGTGKPDGHLAGLGHARRFENGRREVNDVVELRTQGEFGTGGTVTLRLDEQTIGEGRFEKQVAGYFTANETFDVGCDPCSPVSELYESPFRFTGTIERVMVDVSDATFAELAARHEANARAALAMQ
jgi:arylsulfatase